jgi:hypothetical protein
MYATLAFGGKVIPAFSFAVPEGLPVTRAEQRVSLGLTNHLSILLAVSVHTSVSYYSLKNFALVRQWYFGVYP